MKAHIYHLASAAPPPHYQANTEHRLLTNVMGDRNWVGEFAPYEAPLVVAAE